ncbi:MAG: inosine monophosphate cyclohydrolase [Oscillibacter sp.]|nr:inosine monophosphate cyclohydrolase [Oscillibacter sp.]
MKQDLCALLRENSYPGRGIMLGRSADGKSAVIAYFIMGRSENSRNRVFEETQDGIRTKAFDESKMTDPSLIIYHPVRRMPNGITIVTNGDQTDTIRDSILQGHCYRHGLHRRAFEPDGPNWTPRISGEVLPDGRYALSILKSLDGDESCCCRYFYEYDAPKAGSGHFICTYQGDGNPLPSFAGEPVFVDLTAPDAPTLAKELWESLNEDNKVALFVEYIDLEHGARHTVIQNKHC